MDCACQGAVAGVDIAEPGLLNAAQSPAHHDIDLGMDQRQGLSEEGQGHNAVKEWDGMMH